MSRDGYGECAHCGAMNLYSTFDCRGCGARLPWAEALTQKLLEGQRAAQTLALAPPSFASPLATPTNANVGFVPQAAATPSRQAYCAHCGSPHATTAAFCPSCGTRILAPDAAHASIQNTRTSPLWPFGARQTPAGATATPMTAAPHALSPNAATPPASAYLSPQQNVNVNVVTHQQDTQNTQIQHRHKRSNGGRFAWRLSLLLFVAAAGIGLAGAAVPALCIAAGAAILLLLRALW